MTLHQLVVLFCHYITYIPYFGKKTDYYFWILTRYYLPNQENLYFFSFCFWIYLLWNPNISRQAYIYTIIYIYIGTISIHITKKWKIKKKNIKIKLIKFKKKNEKHKNGKKFRTENTELEFNIFLIIFIFSSQFLCLIFSIFLNNSTIEKTGRNCISWLHIILKYQKKNKLSLFRIYYNT